MEWVPLGGNGVVAECDVQCVVCCLNCAFYIVPCAVFSEDGALCIVPLAAVVQCAIFCIYLEFQI